MNSELSRSFVSRSKRKLFFHRVNILMHLFYFFTFSQLLDENHQKYKFMETNMVQRRRRLKNQIPDITSSLAMIKQLREKAEAKTDTETQFLLSDQVYAKATIPPTDKVHCDLLAGCILGRRFRSNHVNVCLLLSKHRLCRH